MSNLLSVEDLKAHLRVTLGDDDALIEVKIAAAEDWIGQFVGKPLAEFDPLPESLKEAVRQLVAHWYNQREAVLIGVSAENVPLSVFDLMQPHRTFYFG